MSVITSIQGGTIYMVQNKINGMVYIGQTKHTVKKRWKEHVNASSLSSPYLLHAAIAEFGRDSFEISEVAYADSQELLNQLERVFIHYHGSNMRFLGYNIQSGGFGAGKHSEESLARSGQKNRLHNLGRKASKETRDKMSRSQQARFASMSKEERASLNQNLKGKSRPESVRLALSMAHKGKVIPQEMRDRIAVSLRGRKLPIEVRKKISDSMRGKDVSHLFTAESRQRRKDALSHKYVEDPAYRVTLSIRGKRGAAARWSNRG
jgi:group I intron endonuclease